MSPQTTTAARAEQTAGKRFKLRAELRPAEVYAIIDSREQMPFDLVPLRTRAGTLQAGDYSIQGLESLVAIERKSLPDLLSCIAGERRTI